MNRGGEMFRRPDNVTPIQNVVRHPIVHFDFGLQGNEVYSICVVPMIDANRYSGRSS
jgi:hypothetical protein